MKDTSLKLYEVLLRGCGDYMRSYVIAENSDEAYQLVRQDLDRRDYGFQHEREMRRVKLLAELADYPDCKTHLLMKEASQ